MRQRLIINRVDAKYCIFKTNERCYARIDIFEKCFRDENFVYKFWSAFEVLLQKLHLIKHERYIFEFQKCRLSSCLLVFYFCFLIYIFERETSQKTYIFSKNRITVTYTTLDEKRTDINSTKNCSNRLFDLYVMRCCWEKREQFTFFTAHFFLYSNSQNNDALVVSNFYSK